MRTVAALPSLGDSFSICGIRYLEGIIPSHRNPPYLKMGYFLCFYTFFLFNLCEYSEGVESTEKEVLH